jgi:hypothetical protein
MYIVIHTGTLSYWIKSHSGRGHEVAERCHSVLVAALKQGIFDPYLRPWEENPIVNGAGDPGVGTGLAGDERRRSLP